MDRCLLIKLALAAGGAAAGGGGGYYAKGMTGAAVGAGVGGILGWLLAPGCSNRQFERSTSTYSPVAIERAKIAPMFEARTPACPARQIWNAELNRCIDYVY